MENIKYDIENNIEDDIYITIVDIKIKDDAMDKLWHNIRENICNNVTTNICSPIEQNITNGKY